MKKLIVLLTLAAFLVPAAVFAAVNGTSHDMTLNGLIPVAAGNCSSCHIPHGASGNRLFPDSGTAIPDAGTVGNLCGMCHAGTGTYGGAALGAAESDGFVYNVNSHGMMMSNTRHPDQDSGWLVSGALPYVSTGDLMECTSCHNVHDDTVRPFLRIQVDTLCSACHRYRHYVADTDTQATQATNPAAGAWVAANTGTGNPGSHPVGTDISTNLDALTSINIGTEFQIIKSVVVDGWVLGPKSTGAASNVGVTCVTCHAVHGAEDDVDDLSGGNRPAADVGPYTNFLAYNQISTTITYTTPGTLQRDVASGYGSYNTLCEACHNNGAAPLGGLNAGAYAGTAVDDHAVDPGASGYTHPLDGITPSDDTWVTAFPGGAGAWPVGDGGTFAQSTPVAICESCHVAYPEANNTANVVRPDVIATATNFDYILRDTAVNVCARCHSGSGSAHHPTGMTFDGSGTVSYLTNASTATDLLSCTTCHDALGAHNWTARYQDTLALDANWLPADNGRTGVPATEAVAANMSQTCQDCHFEFTGATVYNPSLDGIILGEAQFQDHGDGSHFMGNTGDTPANMAIELTPVLAAVYTPGTLWPVGIEGASGSGFSRFRNSYGGNVGIVCESCHELEPDKNNGPNGRLLLSDFTEGANGNENGDADGRDAFCESCHLPGNSHPVSGQNVGRTGAALDVDFTDEWLTDPGATDVSLDAGSEWLSCDGCHQPHNADTNSANFILDYAGGLAVGAGLVAADGGDNLTNNYPDANKGPDHQAFCQRCHGY